MWLQLPLSAVEWLLRRQDLKVRNKEERMGARWPPL